MEITLPERPLLLKLLLRERHWQNYGTFCAEYDKAAARMTLTWPEPSPAAPSCTAGSPARCAACPTPTTAGSWRKCSPAGPPNSSSSPPAPTCSTSTAICSARRPSRTSRARQCSPRPRSGCAPSSKQAFTAEHVTIDFAGFSGETLHGAIQEPLDNIRIGRIKPATLSIRMLLSDTSRPMVLPCRADDLTDDPEHRARAHRLTTRHAHAILDTVQELAALGLIDQADAQIRAQPARRCSSSTSSTARTYSSASTPSPGTPSRCPSGPRDIYDPMGKDAVVFHHSAHSGHPADAPYVEQARAWFTSIWDNLSYEFPA